jgi:hypothetical protein
MLWLMPSSRRSLTLHLINLRPKKPRWRNGHQRSLGSRKRRKRAGPRQPRKGPLRPRQGRKRPLRTRQRKKQPPRPRQARVVGAVDAEEVAVVGAPHPTRPNPPKQSSLRRTKLERSTVAPTSPLRARVAAAAVVADGEKRPHRLQTTRRTSSSEYASPDGARPAMRWPASTGRLGWRPSGNGDAKVVRQVGVAHRS